MWGQEPARAAVDEPADSARAEVSPDTLVGDLPQELVGTLRDTAAAERPFPQLVEGFAIERQASSATYYEWDRDAILRSNALTLLDLLSEMMPGLTPVRATWFGGPHHALNGVLGPGFVTVSIDGRRLTPLDGSQVDLTRIALATVDRVRVRRGADGWVADLTSLRRPRADAYSHITGGTGEPGLSRLRIVFSNSAGRNFNVATSIDLLDVSGPTGSNDFDFWGNVQWIPGDNGAGVELHYETESMDRTVYAAEELDRKSVLFRARGNVSPQLQVEGFLGASELHSGGERLRRIAHTGFRLAGSGGPGWFDASFGSWDSKLFPQLELDGAAGARLTSWLTLDAGGRVSWWDRFTTAEARGGLSLSARPLGLGLSLQGATGSRGVAYPALGVADSVSYDAGAATLSLRIGPFDLAERVEYQKLSRQISFGSVFDRDQAPGGPAELVASEASLAGPILPLSWVLDELDPIRVRGTWRTTAVQGEAQQAYLPETIARGEAFFADEFLEGNLELYLGLALTHRAEMLVPPPGGSLDGELVTIPSFTSLDWNLMIRVLDVRIYWRYDNLTLEQSQDLPNLVFPLRRSVFGVKWQFLN